MLIWFFNLNFSIIYYFNQNLSMDAIDINIQSTFWVQFKDAVKFTLWITPFNRIWYQLVENKQRSPKGQKGHQRSICTFIQICICKLYLHIEFCINWLNSYQRWPKGQKGQ